MTLTRLSLLPAALLLAGAAACSAQPEPPASQPASPAPAPSATPAAATGPQAATPAGAAAGTLEGTVAETMNSGGYTYARLTGASGEAWMAADAFALEVGDTVRAAISMPMDNFQSRTLNRSFERIYFVTEVTRNGEAVGAPASDAASGATPLAMAGSHGGDTPATAVPALTEPIAAPPGGLSVADVWAKRDSLSGTPVLVRGKVVKANYGIMGTNWYHVQDGSGASSDGTNDLILTSSAEVKVGDIVTVSGTLSTAKDFGAGYAYDVIVENAEIGR